MLANLRTFAILASLVLASLVTSTAFAQSDDGPADLPVPPAKLYPIDSWLVEEAKLDRMEPGEFARRVAIETARLESNQEVFDAACTPKESREELLTPEKITACLEFNGQIFDALTALEAAQEYYEVKRPLKLGLTAGAPSASASAPAAETGSENTTYQLDIPGVSGAFMVTMRNVVPDLGSRDAFIVACNGKPDVWNETFDAAQTADRRAVGLIARAKYIVQALRRDDRLPDLTRELDAAVEYVARNAGEFEASSKADHAPLAGLWTRAALKDAGPSACGDLWDFAEAAAARDIIMTGALSAIANLSWNVTFALDGRQAADRHWRHLNDLGGGMLSPPIPPDESS